MILITFRSLTIDLPNDRLYFTTRSNELWSSNLEAGDINTIATSVPTLNTNSIAVDDHWIYVKNRTSIWRLRKDHPDDTLEIVPHDDYSYLMSSMKIVSKPENRYDERRFLVEKERRCERVCVHIDSDGEHVDESGVFDEKRQCQCSISDTL